MNDVERELVARMRERWVRSPSTPNMDIHLLLDIIDKPVTPPDVDLERLKAIKERLAETTQGPWELSGQYRILDASGFTVARVRTNQEYRSPEQDATNARFIANSKADLEYLSNLVTDLSWMLHEALENNGYNAGLEQGRKESADKIARLEEALDRACAD